MNNESWDADDGMADFCNNLRTVHKDNVINMLNNVFSFSLLLTIEVMYAYCSSGFRRAALVSVFEIVYFFKKHLFF